MRQYVKRRRIGTVKAVLLAIILSGASVLAQPAERTVPAWRGERPIRESGAQLNARQALRGARAPRVSPRHLKPQSGTTNAGTPTGTGTTNVSAPPQPLSPQVVGIPSFTGATFADCHSWPPDTMGAVGPTQFIVALNGRVRSFNKATGTADGGVDLDTDVFFSSVVTPGLNFTTDPHIRYDRLSGRWFIVMIDVPGQQGSQPNRVMIAVSDNGTITPSTVWSFYQFQQDMVGATPNTDTGNFADFPTLGIDAQALYIGVNLFTSGGAFASTTAFVVQKNSVTSGGPIQVTAFRGLVSSGGAGPFTPQGVDNYDPLATQGYFIGVETSRSSQLDLLRVSNPGSSAPTISAVIPIAVTAWHDPINLTAKGTLGTNLDGGDARLLAAHLRNGFLWTAHNVGVNGSGATRNPDRDGVRWYQLTGIPTGQTPSVVQSGTVYQPGSAGTQSYWMGTVMVSGQGHAAMGFSTAGPTNYVDAATVGRLATDALGTMETPQRYTSSSSAYNPADDSDPHRWGDYSYTSLDPADDMTMWTVQEWCQTPGDGYAVQVAKLLAPPPALPTNCSPSVLTQGVANVTLTILGSAAGGAGFFDPGPGFSNRLSVVVNGGGVMTVSVQYNNPTNLTAVVSVATNATPGARTLTVFNPDGQSATSASGLLTIASSSANHPPVLAPIPNQTVYDLVPLTFTNSATDPDPGQLLTFSLDPGAPAGATIGASSGVFTWTPSNTQTGTSNITVRVTDNGSPPLSDAQTFTVTVLPWPTLSLTNAPGGTSISWAAIPGKTYEVQYKTNLLQSGWFNLAPVTANGSTVTITNTNRYPDVFYRIIVLQ